MILVSKNTPIQSYEFTFYIDNRATGRTRSTKGGQENGLASVGIDESLDGPLPHYRQTCWITKNPYILAFMNISVEPNGSTSEATNKNARVMVAEIVMLGHIELLASFAMDHSRPTRMAFQNMAVGKNLVPSDKNAGSKSFPVAVWIGNLNSINS